MKAHEFEAIFRRRSLRSPTQTDSRNDGYGILIRLWCLRMLVSLGAGLRLADPDQLADLDAQVRGLLGLDEWLKQRFGDETPTAQELQRELPAQLRRCLADAEAEADRACLPAALHDNLLRLGELIGYEPIDAALLAFRVLLYGDDRLNTCSWLLGPLSVDQAMVSLSRILALPESAVRQALAMHSTLGQSGLLTLERSEGNYLIACLGLVSYGFPRRMLAAQEEIINLFSDAIVPCSPPLLRLSDYDHIRPDLDLLRPYLRCSLADARVGVNVLVHGAPGTGKSQLARVLAADLGCALYDVSCEDENGEPGSGLQRLRALFAAQRLVGRKQALLLFDEVEDVFHDGDGAEGQKSTAQLRKAWMNRLLEQNAVPTIWITNRADGLDPAYIRRFDLVLEVPVPPRAQRERLVRDLAGGLVDEPTVSRLAAVEQLAPAVLTRAAAVLRGVGEAVPAPARPAALARLVECTLTAQGYPGLPAPAWAALAEDYDPTLANCGVDLDALADGLARTRGGRLCLFGLPGTGKTAFGRWLARRLDAPLHVRAVSDLVSAYLGETEKAIALAFREAEQAGAVLLIDEVDSFLRDRQGAQRSWEVTQVNEMLTRMERFPGVFIATTNLMRDLDPAALRRFDLKLRFDWLRPAQAEAMLNETCASLGLPAPDAAVQARLARLPNLAPGDFAAAARQHRFRSFADACDLLAVLEAECRLKPEGGERPIGFV